MVQRSVRKSLEIVVAVTPRPAIRQCYPDALVLVVECVTVDRSIVHCDVRQPFIAVVGVGGVHGRRLPAARRNHTRSRHIGIGQRVGTVPHCRDPPHGIIGVGSIREGGCSIPCTHCRSSPCCVIGVCKYTIHYSRNRLACKLVGGIVSEISCSGGICYARRLVQEVQRHAYRRRHSVTATHACRLSVYRLGHCSFLG